MPSGSLLRFLDITASSKFEFYSFATAEKCILQFPEAMVDAIPLSKCVLCLLVCLLDNLFSISHLD